MAKRGPLCTTGGNADRCSHCGKQHGGSSKNQDELPQDPEPPSSTCRNTVKHLSMQTCAPSVHTALFTVATTWRQPSVLGQRTGQRRSGAWTRWDAPQPSGRRNSAMCDHTVDLENIVLCERSQVVKDMNLGRHSYVGWETESNKHTNRTSKQTHRQTAVRWSPEGTGVGGGRRG